MDFTLDYHDAIPLDAEALAEGGIVDGYESLLPHLRKFVDHPAKIEEDRDDDLPSYSVRCGDAKYAIYGPDLDEEAADSWGRATVALFAIVNEQLKNSSHRLYAINGGNDLFGLFLTPTQAKEAQKSLPNAADWPYIPKDEEPWYGQYSCHQMPLRPVKQSNNQNRNTDGRISSFLQQPWQAKIDDGGGNGMRTNRAAALAIPVLVIAVGVGWLLTALGIAPSINWVWTVGLATAGLLTLAVSGFDKVSTVIGPFFLLASLLSVLRQMGELAVDVEVPILVISIGVLMFMAQLLNLPPPDWMTPTPPPPSDEESVRPKKLRL